MKSAEVDLSRGTKDPVEQQRPTFGEDKIEKSDSEVNLGFDRNHACRDCRYQAKSADG